MVLHFFLYLLNVLCKNNEFVTIMNDKHIMFIIHFVYTLHKFNTLCINKSFDYNFYLSFIIVHEVPIIIIG